MMKLQKRISELNEEMGKLRKILFKSKAKSKRLIINSEIII